MRKSVLQFIVLFICVCLSPIHAQNSVQLKVKNSVSNKAVLESNASALLTQINKAFEAKQSGLDLSNVQISMKAKESLAALWANVRFKCEDSEVIQDCLITSNGFQIRQIPLVIEPQGATTTDDTYQEAVINFEPSGEISSFYFTISTNLYSKVMKNKNEVKDVRRRMLILDYVEHFRTAYNEKDINFLEQIFSDDALIIVGKVIQTSPTSDGVKSKPHVEYYKRTKEEYIATLKKTFATNKFINVKFDEIKVTQHPTKKDFYGVNLHQLYTSSTYGDDGYLFLLWDFRNEIKPMIHVRTWQPKYTDNTQTKIAVQKEDAFTLGDFDIDI